jgi:ADP-heptose:LPS heptosyltransferase
LKKILIIRFSSIGDIVLTTPVVRCLKKQLNSVEVHYLTKNSFRIILENNPFVDKIHTIGKDINEIAEILRKENFDYVIDLHHNLRSFQVKRMLKKPSSSLNKLNIEKWLMVNLKINKLPDVHIVDRYMETVCSLGVKNDGLGLDYFIPAKDEVDTADLPEAHRSGYTGFVIGAAHATKRLPLEKIISICKKLNKPVVLLGGKEDAENAGKIEEAVGLSIFNACGRYNLNQSASLIKQAQEIITHDTGLMHIAAALGKPIVSVWGNTIPEFGMYPYIVDPAIRSKSIIMEVKNLSCRPCSKIGYTKCPRGHFKCMRDIVEDEIISKIKLLTR